MHMECKSGVDSQGVTLERKWFNIPTLENRRKIASLAICIKFTQAKSESLSRPILLPHYVTTNKLHFVCIVKTHVDKVYGKLEET